MHRSPEACGVRKSSLRRWNASGCRAVRCRPRRGARRRRLRRPPPSRPPGTGRRPRAGRGRR
ncbi:hypothetical protein E6W39_08765 [Kitasatospora acidiphila]|uniref:Uncharacterized protein n=1 Tax=Kitasatospora acidiphila TaxID=2567942 RepID=A0A540W037_9ACTN|nr:hypothetical protein E6W39_08765 [Kitasatospora acidiphila]